MERELTYIERRELSDALTALRQELKENEKEKTGRTPVICSDESIAEMVRLLPRKASDFQSIAGLGPIFEERYAEAFLEVLSEYNGTREEEAPVEIPEATMHTLRELSKKLIHINRTNRMLFLPRLSSKHTVDLFDPTDSYNPLDILFEAGSEATVIAGAEAQDLARNNPQRERWSNLLGLIRETAREIRDKGQNDLYIGYPFAEGNLIGGDFPLRAPLCLFPVTLERTASDVTVALDTTRDVVFNATLLLANNKFNNFTSPLPDCTLDDLDPDTFLQTVLDFYRENGIEIEYNSNELKKFKEYVGDSFPKHARGSLKLVHNIVIGKFPTYSSAIQRDFEQLLDKGLINRLVSDLCTDYGETDFYSDHTTAQERDRAAAKKHAPSVSEQKLFYINALNGSQEAVLHAMENTDELVVEGPPGTGKSQTITSLIAQFARQGKSVLMVSEKKTALDVVYSRLGELSRYALIADDSTNKDLFYSQISRLLSTPESETLTELPDLEAISDEIDAEVSVLEVIAAKLFTPGEFGVAPYRLYMENRRLDLQNYDKVNVYKTVRASVTDRLMQIGYTELSAIRKKFENGHLTDSINLYQHTLEHAPWFAEMRDDLSEYELILLSDAIDNAVGLVAEWRSNGFFKRLFTRPRLKRDIFRLLRDYFRRGTTASYIVRLLRERPEDFKYSLENYTKGYSSIHPIVTGLTESETAYFAALRRIHKVGHGSITDWNEELYNTLLFEHIQRFEMANRTLMPQVASFGRIVDVIERGIREKQEHSKQVLGSVLSENLHYLTRSKRHGEIGRVVESRRRPSISKFVQKFEFELFRAVKIWLMTPDAVSEILPQQNGLFDLVIFDEASQLYIEKGIPSIVRAKKVVIAGDHKQLRPSSLGDGRFEITDEMLDEDAEISAALEEESLLDLARFRYPNVLLNTHYRSRYEELIDFSNYAFYKGRLFVAPNTDTPEKPPIEVHLVEKATWQGRANRREAEAVVELLKHFFATRKNNETIGVIAFNVSQRDMIYDVLEEESRKHPAFGVQVRTEMSRKDNGEDTGLFIKNIESVQGDERDVIVFSIGYAKNAAGKLIHNFGWLNQRGGENRLNVAITRAKRKVHIVTSFYPSELSLEDAKHDGPRMLKRYLEYAFAISEGNVAEAEQILASFGDASRIEPMAIENAFSQRVAEALRARGLDVRTQVGIGGYRIDMAICKNGRYVLGIECDGKIYASTESARERDYHRQKYLEARGWRIERIWSMNWWRNPEAELDRICKLVETL